VSPVQLIAMKIERHTLARLRRSAGMPFVEDDGRPGAAPGLIVALCVLGMVSAYALGVWLS
jgi:hypothetical protein